MLELTVILPCRNEAENLPLLLDEVAAALSGRAHEVIVVDDGSTDDTPAVVRSRPEAAAGTLRLVRHARSAGQSAALRSGVLAARGTIILTIDGDGQNDPDYLPRLADRLTAGAPHVGLVAGQRLRRTDTRLKQVASRWANALRQSLLRDGTRDSGCGLKALPADLFRRLPFFDGWHRYLPALVIREGYAVSHLEVVDRARRHGKSNYGILDRGLRGALDLVGVWWLRRRFRPVAASEEVMTAPPDDAATRSHLHQPSEER